MARNKVIMIGGGGGGDASLSGTQTFTGQKTFNLSPVVPITSLGALGSGGSTALTLNTHYQGTTAVATHTLTFSGTPAEGSTTSLKLLATATCTITVPSSKPIGEANSAVTTVVVWPGNHFLAWKYVNTEYVLSYTTGPRNNYAATVAPTVTDDTASGYIVGSIWIDTTHAQIYRCVDGTASAAVWFEMGYRGLPQLSKSAAYTTIISDAGKHILHPTADNNARTFTIDSNANVAYPVGTAITFINQINTVTIAITTDTMTLMSAGTTGSRTLAANGIATAIKVTSTAWVISGTGLT